MRLNRKWRKSTLQRSKAKLEAVENADDMVNLDADELIEITVTNESLREQVTAIESELSPLMRDTNDESLLAIQTSLAVSFEKMMLRISKKRDCPCPFCMAEGVIIANSLVNMALIMENATKYRRDYLQTAQLMYTIFLTSEKSLNRLELNRAKPMFLGSISGDLIGLLGSLKAQSQVSEHGVPALPFDLPECVPPTKDELAKPHTIIQGVLGRIPAMVPEGQDVMLLKAGRNRFAVIRLIRQLTKVGIKVALDITNSLVPAKVCTVELPEEAMAVVYALERLGASATYQKTPI